MRGDLDGQLTFIGPKGQQIPEVAIPPTRTDPDALRRARVQSGSLIPRDAARARWKGEALDLGLAITAMDCLLPERRHAPSAPPAVNDGHD